MIEILQPNGESVLINPNHVSMVRGFETTMSPKRQMTEVLFLSGDWRTFEASYDAVKDSLALAKACKDVGRTEVHDG